MPCFSTFRSVSRNQTEQAVPIPPRGNYQNVHDFLNAFHQQSKAEESVNYNLKASTLPKASEKEGVLALPQATRSTISLAQYYHNKGKVSKKCRFLESLHDFINYQILYYIANHRKKE